MVINFNATTLAATATGTAVGLGKIYLNKNKTDDEKAVILGGITLATSITAVGNSIANSIVIANAEEFVASLTDEQLAQYSEVIDKATPQEDTITIPIENSKDIVKVKTKF